MTKFKNLSLSCLFVLVATVVSAQEKFEPAPLDIPKEPLKEMPAVPRKGELSPQPTDKATQHLEMKKAAGVKKLTPTLKKLMQKYTSNKTGVV